MMKIPTNKATTNIMIDGQIVKQVISFQACGLQKTEVAKGNMTENSNGKGRFQQEERTTVQGAEQLKKEL